jgi:hypothetical protein
MRTVFTTTEDPTCSASQKFVHYEHDVSCVHKITALINAYQTATQQYDCLDFLLGVEEVPEAQNT